MEDKGGGKDHDDGEDGSTSIPTNTQSRDKDTKAKRHSKEPANQKKKSLRRSWRATSPVRKVEIILVGIAAAATAGYLISYIVISRWQTYVEHMPVVVHSQPPAFLQPFTCDPKTGFHTGNIQLAVKNIGTARADDVSTYWMFMKIIPEKRRGDPFIDDRPPGDCNMKVKGSEDLGFPLDVGVETFPEIRQSVMGLPKLNEGETVQLYLANCIFYWDDQGTQHTTCDRYRLNLPSSNPLDSILGSPSFVCDGQPKNGKFMSDLGGHCEN